MSEYKQNNSIWLLIVLLGFIVISSFFSFRFEGFDWSFFVIAAIYIFVSQICGFFINKLFVDSNKKVICSRRIKYNCYKIIDDNSLWEKLFLLSMYEKIIINCVSAYQCYEKYLRRKYSYDWVEKNKIPFIQFRTSFIKNECAQLLSNNGISRSTINKIVRLQKTQEDYSYWEKEYLCFKKNEILPKQISSYLVLLLTILLSIIPIIVSIITSIKIEPTDSFLIRLVMLGVMFFADLVYLFFSIRTDIKNEYAKIEHYNNLVNQLTGVEKDQFLINNPSYFAFYEWKVPNNIDDRRHNINHVLDHKRDDFYKKNGYMKSTNE